MLNEREEKDLGQTKIVDVGSFETGYVRRSEDMSS